MLSTKLIVYLFASSIFCKKMLLVSKNKTSKNEFKNVKKIFDSFNLNIFSVDFEEFEKNEQDFRKHFDIEEDQVITGNNAPWHLDRINQRNLPLNGVGPINTIGSCHTNSNVEIDTYIIDSGIDINHSDFEGRATFLANFIDTIDTDCYGHGTHVAGIVGSKSYGVCRDAKLYAVKVLDCSNYGSVSGLLAGINYAYNRHLTNYQSNSKVRSIINISIRSPYSATLNKAIEDIISNSNTVYFVVSAGNSNENSCNQSPASANGVISVMASDSSDVRASWSNYGSCAHIYAPGVNVLSLIPNEGTFYSSGTSMSAPIISGFVNHYVDVYPTYNQASIKNKIVNDGTKNKITNNPSGTINRLAYLAVRP